MDLLKMVIEYRPRLQSCHIFIFFQENFNRDNINIKVLEKSIVIKLTSNEDKDVEERIESINLNSDIGQQSHIVIDTSEFFSLDTSSMSGLAYSDSEIIFRLQTRPNAMQNDSLEKELLTSSNDCTYSCDKYQIAIQKSTPYIFECSKCKNHIFKTEGFKRILELPSENLDMSDWFCHNHNSCTKRTNKLRLEPDKDELFYKDYFIIINKDTTTNIEDNNNIKCQSCSSCIGMLSKTYSKIYNSSVQLNNVVSGEISSIFSFKNLMFNTALQDFWYITKRLIRNSNEFMLIPQMCKIIYETTSNSKKYLLLWIIESNVKVLTNNENHKLKLVDTPKLLYKIENIDGKIYKKWKEEEVTQNILIEVIPHKMFLEGCEQLKIMSQCISEKYKYVDEFIMTYLYL